MSADWRRRMAVTAASALVLWLYAWTVAPAVSQMGNPTAQTAHYNLLVDGFLGGQLNLKKNAPPELATLADPYDPAQNAPYRLHDASYFQGKFYLYFGPTPALVLLLPYTLVTGHYLWHHEAVALLCGAGFLVSVGLLCALRRRYFRGVGVGAMALLTLTLGLANGGPMLLRRPDMWELPIAGGTLGLLLSLAALWRAMHSVQGGWRWQVLASLAYGLAVASRPTLLPGAAILLIPLWRTSHRLGAWLAATFAPIMTVGVGLAWYNAARFGQLLEFGQNYQLAFDDQHALRHFGLDFIPFNLRIYFWEPTNWSAYFPFVRGITLPPRPPGQFGVENPYGVLTNMPILLGAIAAGWVAWRTDKPLRSWLAAVALSFGLSALTVSCFGGACLRYEFEFLAPLCLLAVVGVLSLEQQTTAWRWIGRTAWMPLAAFSMAFSFFAACEHGALLRARDPRSYLTLAAACNAPVARVERWLGHQDGPLELRVTLPPFRTRRVEPLLVTGYGVYADYVWVEYIDFEHLRVGLEHTGYGGSISESIAVDYAKPHIFVIDVPSLYAPPGHPAHRDTPDATLARIELDDREILRGKFGCYDASPLTRWVGKNPFAQHLGAAFSGSYSARTLGPFDVGQLRQSGAVELKLWFPRDQPKDLSEPLVVTGETGRGDIVFVRYLDAEHIAIGFDHWGTGGPMSPPVAIDRSVAHRVEVQMGSLGASDPSTARRLSVKIDGGIVLEANCEFHPATTRQAYFGWNPIGGSTTTARFTGRIVDGRRGL